MIKLSFSVFSLLLLGASSQGANWYVRPSSAGSNNGSDWNNAWTTSTINWANVAPGDVLWLAGGTYSKGIVFSKSGSSGNLINLKRVLSTDSVAVASPGWNSSFDSQVVITPAGASPFAWSSTSGAGSFVSINGRTRNGILAKYDNSANWSMGSAYFNGNGTRDVTIANVDLAGPGGASAFNYQGDNAPLGFRPTSGNTIYNITVTNCTLRGGPNIIRTVGNIHDVIIDHCTLKDNVSGNSNIHDNLLYNEVGHHWTIRYCDISGWNVEGIIMWDGGSNAPWWVYGNVFHDPAGSNATAFWPGSNTTGAAQGPLYLYNNTFVGVTITSAQSRSWQFASGSISRNNIFWNSTFASNSVISDSNYNFSNGTTPGNNSISGGSNPFVNLTGKDFKIISTVGTKYPKDKGVALTSEYGVDQLGVTRGGDGAWDMGSYENNSGGAVAPTPPTNLHVTP